MPRSPWWVVLVVGLQLFTPARAGATQCRAMAGASPALAAIDAETRLAWLDHRLAVDAKRARIWAITWGMAYGTITIGELALIRSASDTGSRAEKVVGASAAFIGVLAGAALPLKVMRDQTWWEHHYALQRGKEDPCALVNTAELLLARDAESEAFGVGPLVHVGNFVINIAAGLVLGLGYNRWAAFGYTAIVGIAVGEVQASSQPTDVIEDLRLYRNGELDGRARPPHLGAWALSPIIRPDGLGGALTFAW